MTLFDDPVNGAEIKNRLRTRNVLSIQSHVVHGYVGNKAATFPLQYRGWNVDALNTVQFSNHPGYGNFTGFSTKSSDLDEILQKGLLEGLRVNYDAVLTGYLPCIESLKITGKRIGALCNRDPNLKWILDPVLGDNGKLYVAEENIPVYKDILRGNKIFLVTPNQFEMETLTGVKIDSLPALKSSFEQFHDLYPTVEKIVVTSIELSTDETQDSSTKFIYCACFDTHPTSGKLNYFKVPKLDAHFSGSGDLFSALLLDLVAPADGEDETDLPGVLWKVLLLVDKVLRRTLDLSLTEDKSGKRSRVINDLKLIQCADLLDTSYNIEGTIYTTLSATELR